MDKDYYNKLPYYFARFTAQARPIWQVWKKLITGRFRWQPNMGPIMRRATQEYSPIIRQEAHPTQIDQTPDVDMFFTRERTNDVRIYRKRFVSREFHFLPEFQDFFQHVDHELEDLTRQITVYEDLFYRTRVFHHSPFVYIAGHGLIDAPTGIPSSDGSTAKSNAWILEQLEKYPPTTMSMKEMFKALNAAETEVGMTPYAGTGKPNGTSKALDQRFCYLLSSEAWNSWVDDPWVRENRKIDVDIVTDQFHGDLLGRVRCMLEDRPLRYKVTESGTGRTLSLEAPQISSEAVQEEEKYRTRPNNPYSRQSQFEVHYLIGGSNYSILDSGPPPSMFAKSIETGIGMNWNGKPWMNKDFLTYCKNSDGAVVQDTNSWGEFLRLQAQLAMGIAADNAFNIIPVITQRSAVGLTTAG